MQYGFIVHVIDKSGSAYRYFAQYAQNEEEARNAFHIDSIINNDTSLVITSVIPATKFEWEHFDWHGDCYNSPNAKHGISKRKPNTKQNQKSKPSVFKKSNLYKFKFK